MWKYVQTRAFPKDLPALSFPTPRSVGRFGLGQKLKQKSPNNKNIHRLDDHIHPCTVKRT